MPATKQIELNDKRFKDAITSRAWRRREWVVRTVSEQCRRNPDDVDAAISRMVTRGKVMVNIIRETEYVRGT